jgi:hypothetical protein
MKEGRKKPDCSGFTCVLEAQTESSPGLSLHRMKNRNALQRVGPTVSKFKRNKLDLLEFHM